MAGALWATEGTDLRPKEGLTTKHTKDTKRGGGRRPEKDEGGDLTEPGGGDGHRRSVWPGTKWRVADGGCPLGDGGNKPEGAPKAQVKLGD
jgi:hypothetical protein